MRTTTVIPAVMAAILVGFTIAAARRNRAAGLPESHPGATLPPAPSQRAVALRLPPPTAAEAAEALRRAFGDAVLLEPEAPLVARDFNDDGAEDLAVEVRPMPGRLAEVNDRVANWTVQDALDGALPAPPPPGGRAGVEAGEVLVAVVHGHGARGWRSPEARQCYLVRHAAGPPFEARPRSMLLRRPHGPLTAGLAGDVIVSTVNGRTGFIYWNSARYTWQPLAETRGTP